MKTLDLRDRGDLSSAELHDVLPRAEMDIAAASDRVTPILADVRARGAAALADYSQRFDGIAPPSLRVPADQLQGALAELDPAVRAALTETIARLRGVHTDQLPREHTTTVDDGATITQRWIPVQRVGLYVPGGLAVYPSSVAMNVVPAQVAGVPSLVVVSPPQREFDGWPHPTILATCALLGIEEVYAVGGAQAIALLAYGIADSPTPVEPVDVITGPGNIWVATAKRLVRGEVGIDAEAGPTEIGILADHTADPAMVAADLISQAEHDPLAASVLVTDSPDLAERVNALLPERVRATKHHERVQVALRGEQSAIVLVADMAHGLQVVNAYGAEHLEIHAADADALAQQVHNAGAIFVGSYSPVPLGDYLAGSNHVLPTGGTARFASGLGVHAFVKSVQQIHFDAAALQRVGGHIAALAQAEDLPAHGESIAARTTPRGI